VLPCLIYRILNLKSMFPVFNTGRIVCMGAKTKEMVCEAIAKLVVMVKELGLTFMLGKEGDERDDGFA